MEKLIFHCKDPAQAVEEVGVNWCSKILPGNILNLCIVRQDTRFFSSVSEPTPLLPISPSLIVKRHEHTVKIKTGQWINFSFRVKDQLKKKVRKGLFTSLD